MLEEKSVAHNLFTDLSRANPEFKLFVPAKNNTLETVNLSVDSVCLFFEEQKLQQGDRVTIIAHKNIAYFEIYLAALKFGLVFNPLNPAYTEKEVKYFIDDFKPDLVMVSSEIVFKIKKIINNNLKTIEINELIYSKRTIEFTAAAVRPQDLAVLLYSSGTTGLPKPIGLSHENLKANAVALSSEWGLGATDVLLHTLPMYHIHGLLISLNSVLLSGAYLIALSNFTVEDVMQYLERATIFMGVPTYYHRILNNPTCKTLDYSKIRLFISGSAPLSETILKRFKGLTGHTILERYGMTETGVISSNPVLGKRKPGSVGKAISTVSLQVRAIADGEVGEVWVKGKSVSKMVCEKDGWFKTGDLGYLDDDDYLFLVGRSKDMIITGGMNVYPKEIEKELEQIFPGREIAVFGVPHNDFGEAVVAAVTGPQMENDEIEKNLKTLKSRIANYKVPKTIFNVKSLPTNVMGKVQKNILRDKFHSCFEV